MAAITAAVVGTAVAIKGQRDAKKAQQNALNQQSQANIESANILSKAGREAEADILRQNNIAGQTSSRGTIDAMSTLAPFVDYEAMKRSQNEIIGNLGLTGPIADSIRQGTAEYINSRPEFQNSNIMQGQAQRQGDLAVGAAGDDFRQRLLTTGQQGLAAATDVANIEQSGIQRLADLAGNTSSARSSLLIGQTGGLANLSSSANEARLLSGVAGQNAKANQFESLGNLAGQLYDPKGVAGQQIRSGIQSIKDSNFTKQGQRLAGTEGSF